MTVVAAEGTSDRSVQGAVKQARRTSESLAIAGGGKEALVC